MFKSLNQLKDKVLIITSKKRLVLAAAQDPHALMAVLKAGESGWVHPILVGNQEEILNIVSSESVDMKEVTLINQPDVNLAVEESVRIIRRGDADILMKGGCSTATLLKAVLHKEWGLRKGELLSHFALLEIPSYHKLLGVTDVAINISPGLEDKVRILRNAVDFMNGLGWGCPKVALIAAVEVVNEKMQATVDAAAIKDMAQRELFWQCLVDGPMALDNAISRESALLKGISSAISGDPDLLLMPNIESGNVFYKAMTYLGSASVASVVLGASVPIVLTSRSDSEDSKLNSILLAALDGSKSS